ncbi:MAG: UDP-N-acetylmuramoyl-tripeptide--D-alanyl-D-alanine ligase, partial [Gammaproteobacteria bacterium]|nr:UDP-N-acetylmuramoyl-tripeptide--D-alanyl-D-alanine ligase [Gemmatimonadota bacterium]NIU72627.1 UDP-N-acetylmuramoyl-tripeptide--D-alanyl-D-alanine ligase [Gammaproteobacteria bacterium]
MAAGSLRGEIRRLGGLTVLVDCYNANPQSVRAALDLLEALPAAEGRVAVLGSMLELGDRSEPLHDEL